MKATTGRSEEEGGGRDRHLRRASGGHLSRGGEPDVSGTPARSQHTGRLQGGRGSPSRTPVPGDTRCSAPRSRAEPRARRPRSPWKPSALGGKGTRGRSAQTPPLSRRRWAGGLRGLPVLASWDEGPRFFLCLSSLPFFSLFFFSPIFSFYSLSFSLPKGFF